MGCQDPSFVAGFGTLGVLGLWNFRVLGFGVLRFRVVGFRDLECRALGFGGFRILGV